MDPVSKARADSANSAVSKPAYQRGLRPFVKGQSGNPSGRPKKNHVTKMYERILANPNKRKQLEEAVFNRMVSERMVGSLELRECADRTEGKVSQIVDMNVTGTITLEQVLEAKKKAKKD